MQRSTIILLGLAFLLPSAASAQLGPPTGFIASADSCWGVYLSWDALPGADSFAVGTANDIWFTTELFFRDSSVPVGDESYWVAGIDTSGFGDSATVQGTRPPGPPVVPGDLAASNDRCDGILLSWIDVQDEEGILD